MLKNIPFYLFWDNAHLRVLWRHTDSIWSSTLSRCTLKILCWYLAFSLLHIPYLQRCSYSVCEFGSLMKLWVRILTIYGINHVHELMNSSAGCSPPFFLLVLSTVQKHLKYTHKWDCMQRGGYVTLTTNSLTIYTYLDWVKVWFLRSWKSSATAV